MAGLNKFTDKERRKQRLRNYVAKELLSGMKYRQRVVPDRKKIENDDGSYYFRDPYYDEGDE